MLDLQVLRKLIVPAIVVACGSVSACSTAGDRSTQALAPARAAAVPQAEEEITQAAGTEEDGARSLASELERKGKKPAAAAVQTATVAAQPDALATAVEPVVEVAQTDEDKAGDTGLTELPATAMLPERRPAGMIAARALEAEAAEPKQQEVQVASLDPQAGMASQAYEDASNGKAARPVAQKIDPESGVAHSRPAPSGRVGPDNVAARSPELDRLITHYSNYYGVPEKLVRRVAKRESTMNPKATNGHYVGLMQISVPTARGMGYKGSRQGLLDAETNLKYAVRYLRGAYVVANGNHDRADRLYQTGYYYHAKRAGLLDETGVGTDRKRRRGNRG